MRNTLIRTLACVAAAGVMLTGCATQSGPTEESSGDSDRLRIVMLLNDQFDPYYLTLVTGAEAKAAELGVDFDWQAPTTLDVASQTALLQSVAATNPDGIIMSALDADAMVAPMRAVMDSGIPIITVDADVNDESARLGTVRSDGHAVGDAAAEYAIDLLGGEGEVGYVGYIPGIQSVDIRLDGWNDGIAEADGITNVGEEFAEADVQENVSKTSALLSREPDLDVIFASWTNATIGASQAVQQAGRDVSVVGVDASPEQVSLLQRGLVSALIVQRPYDMGGIAIEELFTYVNDGVEPQSEVLLDAVVATQENMDDPDISVYFYTESE
ncbi:MAG TPA: substrate-binding domain-containing protein [Candidatus Agrococcus pullicola]|uniref:Substrate-binding domain-containing protein n=1 Tax=Candidatus Agrococcus pullicola TaxID=2838429 RepID=A0A9D2C8M8_9MICO|nr:substrate-binding domain-containing protein [Candidatus Agrococcus pullicola]